MDKAYNTWDNNAKEGNLKNNIGFGPLEDCSFWWWFMVGRNPIYCHGQPDKESSNKSFISRLIFTITESTTKPT